MSTFAFSDVDPIETQDWLLAIDSLVREEGAERAQFILDELLQRAKNHALHLPDGVMTDYLNTISVADEPAYPGDLKLEERIQAAIRWNALMTVLRASKKDLELGGHLSSYQSASTIYEVAFNHFFKAASDKNGGDLVYFQGHCSPGIYARAFLEGRLTEQQLDNFRQEVDGKGISSYPHPTLMPTFWQFSTVSMGLGPLNAIYQARFLKYLNHRGLKDTQDQTVYAFCGDGEMDEVESRGALAFAGREKLDNLVFVINCNLQRLDGPVSGNSKIVQELEANFKGAGWKVIKVMWGSEWDALLAKDTSGKLRQLMMEVVDGDYQTISAKDGAYLREHFFGRYSETAELVRDLSDEELLKLTRGGHDPKKVFAAFDLAKKTKDQPVVLLMHTVKGFGMGDAAEGKNVAHQVKKLPMESIRHIRDRYDIPFSDEELENLPYFTFSEGSPELNYLHQQRQALAGYVPSRSPRFSTDFEVPALEDFAQLFDAQARPISTTMAFVRTLNILLKNKNIGKQIVPIIADEARTFGMEGLFRQIGIYNPQGQNYTPQDKEQVAYYREATDGQVLQEGINEQGATASWLAAATSYSVNNLPMVPFFVYYSMFGFQRVGDLMWLAGDQDARGFMIGGTSGRTTLNGEGLQHQDGHSHIQAGVIPSCVAYDPAFAFEVPVIIQDGLRRMYGENQENIFYYLTTLNETYEQPAMPQGAEEGIRKGLYKFESIQADNEKAKVQLLGSGSILRHVRIASEILAKDYGISSDIFSATSLTEVAREGEDAKRFNRLHPTATQRTPHASQVLADLPTIAATDYVKLFAEQIRPFVPTQHYTVLGTDGFGRSDSRENLRRHFEVDAEHIVVATLSTLKDAGLVSAEDVQQAIDRFALNANATNPLYA